MPAPLREAAVDPKTGYFTPVWEKWFARTLEPVLIRATSGLFEKKSATISGGEITVTDAVIQNRFYTVDTEGGAATDDLDNIMGGNTGEFLIIEAADSTRTVVLKDGANLDIGSDFTLNHKSDKFFLVCIEANIWHQITRASNAS